MAAKSAIEWTDATWTPVRARNTATGKLGWHCAHVSEGCRNCYAEAINLRLGTGLAYKRGHLDEIEIFFDETMLLAPLHWRKPRMIFVGSMTDLFADFVPDAWLDKIFAVMALCPQHTFQVLTKRPERMRKFTLPTCDLPVLGRLPLERVHFEAQSGVEPWESLKRYANLYSLYCSVPWPLPNVWLGVSCEDQATADARVPDLLATPAAVRFVSAEPLLGPLDLRWALSRPIEIAAGFRARGQFSPGLEKLRRLDWIIVGGESGPGARPMHPDWARSIRDQCNAAGVAFHFKQHGEWLHENQVGWWPHGDEALERHRHAEDFWRVGKKVAGRLLDGVEHNGIPKARTAP
ncbi:MAG: phage Gp37/Gp68 family protein [Beijerinckiaceae bacterium]|nr:phage Gp37/Gp68 family protein [Beijerinckiaceae bacterium]